MVKEAKIQRVNGQVTNLAAGQIGVEVTPDVDLNYIMWGGKDYAGNVTKFLCKDKIARVEALAITSLPAVNGLLQHDASGVVTGGLITYAELNAFLSDGPIPTGENNTASTLPGSGVDVFAQKVGSDLQFRGLLNTSGNLALTQGVNDVDIDLATTTVTPGSYTLAALNVDSFGRITDISNGSMPTHGPSHVYGGADEVVHREFDGCVIQQQDTFIVASGGKVYAECELLGGGDLPIQLDGVRYLLNCTAGAGVGGRARVELTPGTDTSETFNFVYVELDTGVPVLKSSIISPTGSFAYVMYVTLLSYTRTAVDGALSHQRSTDAIFHNGRGRISHIDAKLRQGNAQWSMGVLPTVTIDSVPSPDTVDLHTTLGLVWQLHAQIFPAKQLSTDGAFVVNASGDGVLTPYEKITDLGLCLEDVKGVSLAGTRFNLVVWGAVNKTTGECKYYVNLPANSYSSDEAAYYDIDTTSITTVPRALANVAFLICRIPLRHKTPGGGVFEFINPGGAPEIISLLGAPVGGGGGSGGGGGGVEQLNDLSDTMIITPSAGQLLMYDGVSHWQNDNYGLQDAFNAGKIIDTGYNDLTIANSFYPGQGLTFGYAEGVSYDFIGASFSVETVANDIVLDSNRNLSLKNTHTTTGIELSDASNPALVTTNKTLVGSVNEVDTSTFHIDQGSEIAALDVKATPAGSDVFLIEDSDDANAKKRLQLSDIPVGEANTSSNRGAGFWLATAKIGDDLPFRSLLAGEHIEIDGTPDDLTFNLRPTAEFVSELWRGELMGQATGVTGLFCKAPLNQSNPSGLLPLTAVSQNFIDGLISPYPTFTTVNITYIHILVSRCATGVATVGTAPTIRLDIYTHGNTSRTLVQTVRVPVTTGVGSIYANDSLAGTGPYIVFSVDLSVSPIGFTKNNLVGYEFVPEGATEDTINALSRCIVTMHAQSGALI